MSLKEREVYHFGPFVLDPVAKVLFRNGEAVSVPRKAVETLQALVEHPGQVLTKDEIRAAVWPDRVVDDANLLQNIAVVRRALAVERDSPAFIETFPGRGYRIQGPVTQVLPPSAVAEETSPSPRRPWMAGALLVGLLVTGLVWWQWSPTTQPLTSITALTRLPGKEYQPAISPDGNQTAFVWLPEQGGAPQVWVHGIDGQDRQRSTGVGTASSPVWSTDGQRMAYLRSGQAGAEIVIAPNQTVARVHLPEIESESRLLDWSPDGRSFVVAIGGGLALVDLASGRQRGLTTGGEDISPRFSPDGRQIAFLRVHHRFAQEVLVVSSTGGVPQSLSPADRAISEVDWARDGESVIAAIKGEGEFRLWRIPLSKQPMRALGVYGDFPLQFSLARGTDRLVYAQLQQDRNIWRLELAGRTWKRIIASTAQDASPQYSPDGQWICFRSDRSGQEQLWISRADGSEPKLVTNNPRVSPSVGRWAPDSRRIVFNDPRTGQIFETDREAASVRSLGYQGIHPVYAPDGQALFVGGPSELRRITLSTGQSQTIARTSGVSLAVSPDGGYLYFVRDSKEGGLWRVELSSGRIEKVLDGLVPGCTSCWALVQGGVYYLGGAAAQTLSYYDHQTRQGRIVMPYPEFLWPLGSGPFSLSPDGRGLLTVRVDPSPGDLLMASPFQ